jgi:hypothetical protein
MESNTTPQTKKELLHQNNHTILIKKNTIQRIPVSQIHKHLK